MYFFFPGSVIIPSALLLHFEMKSETIGHDDSNHRIKHRGCRMHCTIFSISSNTNTVHTTYPLTPTRPQRLVPPLTVRLLSTKPTVNTQHHPRCKLTLE
jgi:hypothetical protein